MTSSAGSILCPLCERERSPLIGSHFCNLEELSEDRGAVGLDVGDLDALAQTFHGRNFSQNFDGLDDLLSFVSDEDTTFLSARIGRLIESAQSDVRITDLIAEELGISHDAVLRSAQSLPVSAATIRIQLEARGRRREDLIDAIALELYQHGAPMHYTAVRRTVCQRYPRLRASPGEVLRAMSDVPGVRREWRGVYSSRTEARDAQERRTALLARYGGTEGSERKSP
jgi:hypothetical protein